MVTVILCMYTSTQCSCPTGWRAYYFRMACGKNCKYTVDTPHAPRNFVCAVVSPNVYHKILNMLRKSPCDRRANHTQKVRGKGAVQTPTASCMRGMCAALMQLIRAWSLYMRNRLSLRILCIMSLFHWPAMLLRWHCVRKKNSWYAVDTPHTYA